MVVTVVPFAKGDQGPPPTESIFLLGRQEHFHGSLVLVPFGKRDQETRLKRKSNVLKVLTECTDTAEAE